MDLFFNVDLIKGFNSSSQIARVLTENWVKNNCYCPCCGFETISEYPNNKPVADFYCINCSEDYELKSKSGKMGLRIVDGAYSTMIERIQSDRNPNFFFLSYSKTKMCVDNFVIIPKHFFIPEIIQKRSPLSSLAKRAGWTGCNIDLAHVPEIGKIFLVKETKIIEKEIVVENYSKTVFLRSKNLELKGWIIEVLNCIDRIQNITFTLSDIYKFEHELKLKYPNNNFVRDKIRQQLQILRDLNFIEFTTRGVYKKI